MIWFYFCIGFLFFLIRILGFKFCDIIGFYRVLFVFGIVGVVVDFVLLFLVINWMWLFCFFIVYGFVDGLIVVGVVFLFL